MIQGAALVFERPTSAPSQLPTASPSFSPTRVPSNSPTSAPTQLPTTSPSSSPTHLPSNSPTQSPATSTFSPTAASTGCHPGFALTQLQCIKSSIRCGDKLKWTGKGCRIKKKPVGDGGCQCRGYCGYTCRVACTKDKECIWSTVRKACLVKSTGQIGGPILGC